MKFLIIGQGGREHAIVKALRKSPLVDEIFVAPGNTGIALEATCENISWTDFERLLSFAKSKNIDTVIIGPEDPLVDGLADKLRQNNIATVGPSQAGALLEGSKIFSKIFMQEAQIPTARFAIVNSTQDLVREAKNYRPPYVLKADGLAAGKGVFICKTYDDLLEASNNLFEKNYLGSAGSKALLEACLHGYELSLLLITNGTEYELLPVAQDHKRLKDNDQGPNTGGMGTTAPMPISNDLLEEIKTLIVAPTLALLQKREITYNGIIFLGLMITSNGPYLLEYNCRFGDPETQSILPLLDGDWGQVFHRLARGHVDKLSWKNQSACCVIMAAPGYPDQSQKGIEITGSISARTENSYFIHAGTSRNSEGKWVTNGGRVIGAVGLGNSLDEARSLAYQQAKNITWNGLQMRTDIGNTEISK